MVDSINNNGIGALYATFHIQQHGNVYEFAERHIGFAVALVGSNTIGWGHKGDRLLGRLEYVEAGGIATVQIMGIMRLSIDESEKNNLDVGRGVVVNGSGSVYQIPNYLMNSREEHNLRGVTLAIYDDCLDVLL